MSIAEYKEKLPKNKNSYLCKFVNKKYNINVIDIEKDKDTTGKYEFNAISLYLKYNRYIYIQNYNNKISTYIKTRFHNFYLYKYDGTEINIENLIKFKSSLRQYLPTLIYFMKLDNIVNAYNYVINNYNFLSTTKYVEKLPLAYTFLLCNKKNKIFPKEIAKLIAYKILFFGGRKKNEKGKRLC